MPCTGRIIDEIGGFLWSNVKTVRINVSTRCSGHLLRMTRAPTCRVSVCIMSHVGIMKL